MLNKVFIMGRLTRDPELRRTQNGTPVTSFSLAVDRDFKSQGGEKETDFIDVVAWRSTAEFVAKYFTKGRMAVVEGRLQIATGRTRTATSAARLKLLPTTSILATPSATVTAAATMMAPPTALLFTAHPSAVTQPPWAAISLRSMTRTATCRSNGVR